MKIVYSIPDSDLFDKFIEQWESYYEHDFPTLSKEEKAILKAEFCACLKDRLNREIGEFIYDGIYLLDTAENFCSYMPEKLRDTQEKISEERISESLRRQEETNAAIDLLKDQGYSVTKS